MVVAMARGGRRWSEGVVAMGAVERESVRERERERETRNGGAAQGARSRGGCNGRRWSMVAGGCGGSGCNGERERGGSCRGAGAGKKKGSRNSNLK